MDSFVPAQNGAGKKAALKEVKKKFETRLVRALRACCGLHAHILRLQLPDRREQVVLPEAAILSITLFVCPFSESNSCKTRMSRFIVPYGSYLLLVAQRALCILPCTVSGCAATAVSSKLPL